MNPLAYLRDPISKFGVLPTDRSISANTGAYTLVALAVTTDSPRDSLAVIESDVSDPGPSNPITPRAYFLFTFVSTAKIFCTLAKPAANDNAANIAPIGIPISRDDATPLYVLMIACATAAALPTAVSSPANWRNCDNASLAKSSLFITTSLFNCLVKSAYCCSVIYPCCNQ